MSRTVLVLGSFVADVAFRASRLPAWGETLMGSNFALGPGRQRIQPGCCRGARRSAGEDGLQTRRRHLRSTRAQDVG